MKAATHDRYGPAEVVEINDVDRPSVGEKDILVAVEATTVTTADWRFRASAFPGVFWLPGRLMAGLFRPKNRILGGEFAGRVVAVGAKVSRFKPGDAVFGFSGTGAHAELVVIGEDGPVAAKPANLGFEEAAAVPFGALSALVFLRDFAKVKPKQKVLVAGASGGVGVYLVQLARHFGAEVTGLASTGNVALVESLGADRVIDYSREDFTKGAGTYDVIIDPVGVTTFRAAKRVLAPDGKHVFLHFGLREVIQSITTSLSGGRKVVIGISGDTREDLELVTGLLATGTIRPVIDSRYPLEAIADAHRRVESRHKTGSVVITLPRQDGASPAAT